ncbi:DnaJ C-terminal domain-containing protein [Mycoplasma sp. HS2188]|uniref:DnaJ C-terminal domain-containing protein n=1 Tax=Mycoplasma sp. HS2188 TaxID=2976765 RepID=UPI0021AA3ACC|nr:DnaJ C-terminal domain-containing protein [Mycoplasma sp. HS2188]MCT4469827.1 DnaJ domain-containing protein [Mycoplasma sp. HS2188]
MSKKDYYKILGISKDATEKEIKTAYRKLAMQYHPDKLKDGTSDKKMQEINEAYQVLSDKEKRANYDKYGTEDAPQGFGGFGGDMGGFGDIFGSFFNSFTGSSSSHSYGPSRGDDLLSRIQIDFNDAIKGKQVTLELKKWEICDLCNGKGAQNASDIKTCSVCNGSGQQQFQQRTPFGVINTVGTCRNCNGVGEIIANKCNQCKGEKYIRKNKKVSFNVSEGADTGERIKLAGYGDRGENGGPSGDMYVEIYVKDHKHYIRKGLNLFLEYPVSFLDIVKENEVLVPTPYGNETIKLRRNYQNGQTIILNGKGVKKNGRVGELRITFKVMIPELSNTEFKKMAKDLDKYSDSTNKDFIKQF